MHKTSRLAQFIKYVCSQPYSYAKPMKAMKQSIKSLVREVVKQHGERDRKSDFSRLKTPRNSMLGVEVILMESASTIVPLDQRQGQTQQT